MTPKIVSIATYRIKGVFKFGEHVELQVFFCTDLVEGCGLGQQSTHIDGFRCGCLRLLFDRSRLILLPAATFLFNGGRSQALGDVDIDGD